MRLSSKLAAPRLLELERRLRIVELVKLSFFLVSFYNDELVS